MSTHNLCFRAKIRKNVYPCTPQFYYTKVGCKGEFITQTCFRDEKNIADYGKTPKISDRTPENSCNTPKIQKKGAKP